MKRIALSLTVATAALACAAHFSNTTAKVGENGLTLVWSESGLPPTSKMAYTATADAKVSYGCFNKAGKLPSDKKKQVTFTAEAMAKVIRATNEKGNLYASVLVPTPAVGSRLSCPNGHKAMIGTVTYSNVEVSNTVAGTSYRFPSTYTKTFRTMGK
jgi:hypothetical protein